MGSNTVIDLADLVDRLVMETEPVDRWRILTESLAKLGLNQINYAYLDIQSATKSDARASLLVPLNNASMAEMIRNRHQIPPLSPRERACLQHLARGLRADAIGDRLSIANVTVELHLRRARIKLGAKTMPEAVARALLYQQILPT